MVPWYSHYICSDKSLDEVTLIRPRHEELCAMDPFRGESIFYSIFNGSMKELDAIIKKAKKLPATPYTTPSEHKPRIFRIERIFVSVNKVKSLDRMVLETEEGFKLNAEMASFRLGLKYVRKGDNLTFYHEWINRGDLSKEKKPHIDSRVLLILDQGSRVLYQI